MAAVPFRIPFAFRPAQYAGLDGGRGSARAIWGEAVLPIALLPCASPLGGTGVSGRPSPPAPLPKGARGELIGVNCPLRKGGETEGSLEFATLSLLRVPGSRLGARRQANSKFETTALAPLRERVARKGRVRGS